MITDSKRKALSAASQPADNCREKPRVLGRGKDPERIIGATDLSRELMLLIKWRGSDEADFVLSREANFKSSQTVIKLGESYSQFDYSYTL